jgi:hypothetical protein
VHPDPFGATWEGYKLSLALGERYAEVFIRFSDDGALIEVSCIHLPPLPPDAPDEGQVAARGCVPNTVDVRISVLCSTLACASCGWIAGEVAEDKARQDALEDHVYAQDLDEIWSEARAVWSEFDCALPETPKLDETFTCDKSTKRWFRMTPKSSGYVIAFEHERSDEHRDADGKTVVTTTRTREWDLEWRVLQEIDPARAAEIDANAKAKGEKAKKATKDLIEAFE